jgi:hypothetical protein
MATERHTGRRVHDFLIKDLSRAVPYRGFEGGGTVLLGKGSGAP